MTARVKQTRWAFRHPKAGGARQGTHPRQGADSSRLCVYLLTHTHLSPSFLGQAGGK